MNWNDIFAASATLFFIMDPLGNVPVFNAVLSQFSGRKRAVLVARELCFALIILLACLFAGNTILNFLGLTQPALSLAGGILLFIIALRMIFPTSKHDAVEAEQDPFIVPLAVPLVAGPSTIAILLLLSSSEPERMLEWSVALLLAWAGTTILLVASPFLMRVLGTRGSRALERLMGMILVILATQMLLNGVAAFLGSLPQRDSQQITGDASQVLSSASLANDSADMVVLVAGASGRTGRHAVALLSEQGITVRAMTRDPARARNSVAENYAWVRGDVSQPESLAAAMRGVTHVIGAMGSSSRDPSNSPQSVDHLGVVNLTDAAKRAGVKHVVLISAMGVTRTQTMEPGHMRDLLALKLKGEDYLRASGVAYTVIRPGGLDMSPAGEDGLAISQGDAGGYGMLSRQDLARIAVECLTNPAARNKTFEITGSQETSPDAWRKDLNNLK